MNRNPILKIVLLIMILSISNTHSSFAQLLPKYVFKHEDINGYIQGISFSHDNSKLLTTGGWHAMMWDLKTGERIMILPKNSGYDAIDFSFDDKRIITTHVEHAKIAIWDAFTGNEIKTIQGEIDLKPPSSYTAVTFSPDGKKALCGDSASSLYVIDIETEKVIRKFNGLGGYVKNIQCYPDGDYVLVSQSIVSLIKGIIVIVIDKSCPVLSSDSTKIYGFVYQQIGIDEKYSMVAMDSKTCEIKYQNVSFFYEKNVQISPRGNMLAFTGDSVKSPRITNSESNLDMRTFRLKGQEDVFYDRVIFSRDGNLIAYIKSDTVYIYDISDLTSGVKEAETISH